MGRQLRGLPPDQARADGQRQQVVDPRGHDGDGKADKTTGLRRRPPDPDRRRAGRRRASMWPTAPSSLHFDDTDNDGKADSSPRRALGLRHRGYPPHPPHASGGGTDGMLYFNQSIYIHSHIETPHGVRRLGGGIWQFRPETMEPEVFVRGLVNPWGTTSTDWGQSFATDGAGGEGSTLVVPALLRRQRPTPVRSPARPEPGQSEILRRWRSSSGRHLPDDRGRGTSSPTTSAAIASAGFALSEDGAGLRRASSPT